MMLKETGFGLGSSGSGMGSSGGFRWTG